MPRISAAAVLTAIAFAAIAAWPAYSAHQNAIARADSLPTAAPVDRDYLERGKLIAFWERAAGEHHYHDMMSPRMLSAQYLQRYRESGDIDDVLRAVAQANESLAIQPHGNVAAEVDLAAADLTLHRFRESLAITKRLETQLPGDLEMQTREASLDLELGRYGDARRIIDSLQQRRKAIDPGFETLDTRWLELTGRLAQAREQFVRTTAYANARFDSSAQQRSWFFFRSGELAFEAGDNDAALADEASALALFPNNADALRTSARIQCARHKWSECLDFARHAAAIIPYPETLGYEVDAQRALGDEASATATNDVIEAIERVGNAQHISDRLLAVYYADHGIRTGDAYRIARGELAVRDDIFTEDTLAWAAAQDGRWNEARVAIRKALRFDTQNSLLQYHAAIIALHFGERDEAKQKLRAALALNPQFHPFFADRARELLAQI